MVRRQCGGLESVGGTEDKNEKLECFLGSCPAPLGPSGWSDGVQSSFGSMAQDLRPPGIAPMKRTATRVVRSQDALTICWSNTSCWNEVSRISEGVDHGWSTGLHMGATLV